MSAIQKDLAGVRKQGERPFSPHVHVHAHFWSQTEAQVLIFHV